MPQILKFFLVFVSAFVALYLLMLISRGISWFIDRKILGKGGVAAKKPECEEECKCGVSACPEKPDDNFKEC